MPGSQSTIQVKEFDWTELPNTWRWDHPQYIARSGGVVNDHDHDHDHNLDQQLLSESISPLTPPFDLVVTSDTVYSPDLVMPLLRSLHCLCRLSRNSGSTKCQTGPVVYIALENRDPSLISIFLTEAREKWAFNCARIPDRRIVRAMEKGKLKWAKADWEGIEVWKFQLSSSSLSGEDIQKVEKQ